METQIEYRRRGTVQSQDRPQGARAAEQSVRIRGNFGDWCWLAWYRFESKSYSQAQDSIRHALTMKPRHQDARRLEADIRGRVERWARSDHPPPPA